MTVQIEAGKYYRDAEGQKVGPMGYLLASDRFYQQDRSEMHDPEWMSNGKNYIRGACFIAAPDLVAEWVDEPAPAKVAPYDTMADKRSAAERRYRERTGQTTAPEPEMDIRQHILDTAGKIVNGDRRGAYGTPEMNFERIARFWQAYFDSTGRTAKVTANDVSPMMRLMKEARLCENPGHLDSLVDIVGYTLTGAEVNKVKIDK
jgi:hypothetical protein